MKTITVRRLDLQFDAGQITHGKSAEQVDPQLAVLHREWVRLVLEELLEYKPSVLKSGSGLPNTLIYREPLTGAAVKPDFAVLSGDKARLLITRCSPDTDLSAPIAGETWAASPIERMINLCRATGVRVGLVTDGEQWTLVSVPVDDHALKCGDSLLGISQLKQLERFSIRDPEQAEPLLETANLWRHIEQAATLRRQLETLPSHTAAQIAEKGRLHVEAETQLAKLRAAADFLVSVELNNSSDVGWATRRAIAASHMQAAWKKDIVEFQQLAHIELSERRPFHWPLEFPEVFEIVEQTPRLSGFDAFVGNPPFMGGSKIGGVLGASLRNYLVTCLADGMRGNADLCAYFFLRACCLLKQEGNAGLVATNTISQGDTREVGLEKLLKSGVQILHAIPNRPWPGAASVEISQVWLHQGAWAGGHLLNGQPVAAITSFLTVRGLVVGDPKRLFANMSRSFNGSKVYGQGFVLEKSEADALFTKDRRNREVIFPYMIGEDLNSRPDRSPSRWVINFFDWSLEKAQSYEDCYRIVLEKVKPERDLNNRQTRREKWWQYGERAPSLYAAVAGLKQVLVIPTARSRTSSCWCNGIAAGASSSLIRARAIAWPAWLARCGPGSTASQNGWITARPGRTPTSGSTPPGSGNLPASRPGRSPSPWTRWRRGIENQNAGVQLEPRQINLNERNKMNAKSVGCLIGLIALCVMKVTLVWTIWCCVVGALALIGAARVFYVWSDRVGRTG